jgi:hypothetical protein
MKKAATNGVAVGCVEADVSYPVIHLSANTPSWARRKKACFSTS